MVAAGGGGMNPETLGNLAGLPVEWTCILNHPDLPPGGMGVGTATVWVRWGGGPWWRLDGSGEFRGVFKLRAWLAAGEWSAADAVDLWGKFAQPQPTQEEAEADAQEALAALGDWAAAHARYLVRHAERARAYAAGIGVVS